MQCYIFSSQQGLSTNNQASFILQKKKNKATAAKYSELFILLPLNITSDEIQTPLFMTMYNPLFRSKEWIIFRPCIENALNTSFISATFKHVKERMANVQMYMQPSSQGIKY